MIPAVHPCRSLFLLMLLFCIACLTGCNAGEDELLPATPSTTLPEGNAGGGEPVAINVSVDKTDELFGDVQTREALRSVRFRLVAYRNNSISAANYAGTAVFSVNSSGTVSVVSGTATPASSAGQLILVPGTYAFVLYCYNLNSNPAMLSNYVTMSVYHNQDFMVCNRTGVAVSADNSGTYTLGNISFTRLCARLQLSVTAEGFGNNKITSCAATVSGMSNNSTWTAGQSSLSVSGSSGSINMGWDYPNSSNVLSYYNLVLPQNARNVAVKFTSLTIGGTSYANQVSAKATNQEYAARGNYKISTTIKPNKIIWAPGNLVKNGNTYSFAGKTEYGSYFGWNTLDDSTGARNPGDYSKANDPCTKVSPAGTWVTPTEAQLRELINSGSSFINGGRQFSGKYSDVFLPAAGYRDYDGSIYFVGSRGYCWSSIPNYLTFGNTITIANSNLRYSGHSVRCVKG